MPPERPRPPILIDHGAEPGDCRGLLELLMVLMRLRQEGERKEESRAEA
jgi:hypothetical protein